MWASLWNLRAVDEREAFGIDHRQVYMGVLIQVGVNATAAGVLVTKNLWDPTDENGFTINAKWGLGERVVEGQKMPEQIIFDPTNDGTKIISRADDPDDARVRREGRHQGDARSDPGAGVILTEERAKKLSHDGRASSSRCSRTASHSTSSGSSRARTFWIVQARPYVGS